MAASLACLLLALRAGLALRRARRGVARGDTLRLRRRHLALVKPAVVALAIGFVGGPLSMLWLRGREPFETAHGFVGVTAAALLVAAAWMGRRLERGRTRARDVHALLGVLAALAACGAAAAGLVLLP
jgi:hypothetical protein